MVQHNDDASTKVQVTNGEVAASKRMRRGTKFSLLAAVLPPIIAFGTQILIWPFAQPHSWVLFLPTVFTAAWLGGLPSGIGASFLMGFLVWWRFIPPEWAFTSEPREFLSVGMYVSMGLVLSALQGRLRRFDQERSAALAESERSNQHLRQALNEREIFAALIENSSDFIGIADAQGKPVYVNSAGRRMVGLAPDFSVGSTQIPQYYPPELRAFASGVIVKAVQEQGRWEGQTYFRHWQTGQAIPVSDTHFLIREPEGGRILGMATITRDISEIKRARDELEDANRKLEGTNRELETANQKLEHAHQDQRFLAEAGAILASTLDYEETLTSIALLAVREFADVCIVDLIEESGEIRRLRAVSRDPSLERACEVLSRAPTDRRRPHLVAETLRTQRPTLMEALSPETMTSFAQGGAERLDALRAIETQSAMTVPLVAHGRMLGILALISCTPSRRFGPEDLQLAEALALRAALSIENARLYRAAQRALQARDEVLGVVAHDLRNPLSVIAMQADLLKRFPGKSGSDSVESAATIHRSAVRMNRMIEDLLDIARVEAGQLAVERTGVSAGDVLADAVDAHRPLADARALELQIAPARELPLIWADRDRLLQVFENLIGNALKFTPAGGRISVGAAHADDEVRFWFADTGIGISSEDLPHVFDRFWQARKVERRGAGLGLPIVKGIVEAHGGRIWVESAPGRGSTFFFTIPTAPQAVDSPERAAHES